jgi:hypothetical protein
LNGPAGEIIYDVEMQFFRSCWQILCWDSKDLQGIQNGYSKCVTVETERSIHRPRTSLLQLASQALRHHRTADE